MKMKKLHKAIFPGSFDPFTIGHADLVERGLDLFDSLIIAIGYNEHKQGWIPVEERVAALRKFYTNETRIQIESYQCLTIDFAKEKGANFILRGIRSIKDYEYERDIAEMNKKLSGIETIFFFANPDLSSVSSSILRELFHFGKDIQKWLPEGLHYKLEIYKKGQ